MKSAIPFYIYLVGESSGEIYRGDFSAKPRLSHRDELMKDRLRREYLGPDSENASLDAKARAIAFADLRVRLVSYPSWWVDSGYGMDLFDENVISKLYDECTRVEFEAREEFLKNSSEAAEALAKLEVQDD